MCTLSMEEQIRQSAIAACVPDALLEYIHTRVFPLYDQNDKGHQLDHIFYVIRRSLSFMKQFKDLNAGMVYAIAAYHDIAHHIDKDNHEVLSAEALVRDDALSRFFTAEQIQIMQEAIEDHRASLEYVPRSDYGKIVSSADRSTDIDAFLRRTHAYSLKHFPHYTQEQNIERCYQHMRDKYGNGGYAKHYVVDADYIQFQHTIEQLLADKGTFVNRYLETTGSKEN